MTVTVDFLRHGETMRPTALLGQTDVALSERGIGDVKRQVAGQAWDQIISSPLIRAHHSAEIAADATGLTLGPADPRWAEINFGDWDGKEFADLRSDATTASKLKAFYDNPTTLAIPGGETYPQVEARVRDALYDLAAHTGTILVVSHGGTIRIALALLLGLPIGKLWALRIDCATRLRLTIGRHSTYDLWGELTEMSQP